MKTVNVIAELRLIASLLSPANDSLTVEQQEHLSVTLDGMADTLEQNAPDQDSRSQG